MRTTFSLLMSIGLLAASTNAFGQVGLQNPAGFQAPGGNNNPPGSLSPAAASSPLGGAGGGSLPSLSSVPGIGGLSGIRSSNPELSGSGIYQRSSGGGYGRPCAAEGGRPFDEQRAIKEDVVGPKLANDWRYVLYQGRHWYWMPDNTWRVWVGTAWQPYEPGMLNRPRTASAAVPQVRAYRYSGPGYEGAVYGQSLTRSMNPAEMGNTYSDRYSGPNIPASGRMSDTPTDVRRVVPGMNAAPAPSPQPNKAELNRARARQPPRARPRRPSRRQSSRPTPPSRCKPIARPQ